MAFISLFKRGHGFCWGVICRKIGCIYMDIELSIEVSSLSGRILPVQGCDN